MGKKEKTQSKKQWKLAGEPVYPSLNREEDNIVKESFQIYGASLFKELLRRNELNVPVSVAKTRENAVKASAGYFCGRFEAKYGRKLVIHALARAGSLPTMRAEHFSYFPSFLLGAALWLLDYVKKNCEEEALFSQLPQEPDEDLDDMIPDINDFSHTRREILRVTTVLYGRNKAYRKECRTILKLIDKETASALKMEFRDKLLDYFELVLNVFYRAQPAGEPESLLPSLPLFGQDEPEYTMEEQFPGEYFLLSAPKLMGRSVEIIQDEFHSRKTANLLAGFTVDNPYRLCAAYLLLERDSDVLASLNVLTSAVVSAAEKHLPWAVDTLPGEFPAAETGFPDHQLKYPYYGPAYDMETDEEIMVEGERIISEPQLFYLATGCLLPRDRKPSGELIDWLVRQNMPEDWAKAFAWGAMVASCVEPEDDSLDFGALDGLLAGWMDDMETALDFVEEDSSDEEAVEDYAAQAAELSRQLKEARRAAHDAEQAARKLQEQARKLEAQAERDRAELIQLRDTVYQMTQGAEAEEALSPEVVLPWQVQRRTVICGGHDTWSKAIRPLLPGARFYDREMLPEVDAIKGADVVWIQANALSHKYYYRIIDAAKKGGADIRYFRYASAKKCAEQLAEDELESR
ncbi:MAG: hypothetical protein HFF18_02040 [Oscillospiraceae bacterium]|nr:hypothetical protein [Oscillospiraceae bacterium]